MNQQAPTKLLTYPPFDNMPLLHEQQQFSMQTILNQIKAVIPEKFMQNTKTSKPTVQMLLSQIILGVQGMVKEISTEQPTEESETNSQKGNEEMVRRLMEALQESESRSKKLQIKLLTKIKKSDEHLREKDLEMEELRSIVEEKQIQIDSLTKMNDKKYKSIRQLKEDIYDLQQQLNGNEEKMESEIEISAMMEKQIEKLQSKLFESDKKLKLVQKGKQVESVGVQAQDEEDNKSQRSVLTQAKQKNYIQSIQQLTFELTQAYSKINQLMKVQQKQKPGKKKSKSFYLNSIFK